MSAAQYADPYQLADPRGYAEMQTDLSNSEMFRKKADEWDEAHGLKYHLVTALMVLSGCFPLMLYALSQRLNPYRGSSRGSYIQYRMSHDEIAKAHGLPTMKELDAYHWCGKRPAAWDTLAAKAQRPAQARKPTPARAALAA